jgi:2-polyprenyl-3-methyl-5-hydroxy-6-metoxy-1,4-benzoquinol methylase
VLDVDGHVIAADDLVARVDKFVKRIDEAVPETGLSTDSRAPTEDAVPPVRAPIPPMQALHTELRPPDLGHPQTPRGRATKLAKQVVRKLTNWYVEPRFEVQQNYDGHNIHFAMAVIDELQRVDRELVELRRQNTQLRLQVVAAVERLNRFRREQGSERDTLERNVDSLINDFGTYKTGLDHFNRELERLNAAGHSGVHIDYSEFEDRCRGSSESLRQAQERYVSFFPNPNGSGQIVDIGCGRGEMLQVLIEAGYDVVGLDINQEMIDTCRSKGLPVLQEDGISFLKRSEDESLRGIFCAQVVEHMLTSEVEEMMQLARRKLITSAVLVVETINPRSLFALGNHFFADTSHVRPVHPETLRFICEQVGFSKVELVELSEHPAMTAIADLPDDDVGKTVADLVRSVFGYQDYVIVATK